MNTRIKNLQGNLYNKDQTAVYGSDAMTAEAKITVTIGDSTFQLTQTEARQLYNALGVAIGAPVPSVGPYKRDPDWPNTMPQVPKWDPATPYTIGDPVPNPFVVTCSTGQL